MIRAGAALIALGLALGVALAADSSRAQPERAARLAIVNTNPLVVRGSGFLPAESVRLTVVADGQRLVRHTKASRAGTFTQRFPSVTVDRCNRLIVVAVGSRGSRAAIKPFQLGCPVPLRGS